MHPKQPLAQFDELLDKHPAAHRHHRRYATIPHQLQPPFQKRRIQIRLPARIVLLHVLRVRHLARALVRRVSDDDVVSALLRHPHEPDARSELLAAQAQTEVLRS